MILSIDIGTSRIRVLLFSLDGELLYERSRMTPAETPFDGAAEIDCATLWREVADVIATLTPSVRAVSALGVTAQLGTVFLGRDGAPLAKAMLWSDTRARGEAEALRGAFGHGSYAICGRRMAPELLAPRLLWMRRHRPEVHERIARVASIKDFVVERLTGIASTDQTHASYCGLFDIANRTWSSELAQLCGCDEGMLPRVGRSVDQAGPLIATAADRLGIALGVPVAVGAPDGTAGAIGAGAVRPGVSVDVAGTTDVLLHCIAEPLHDPDEATIVNAHAAPGLWTIGGPTGYTGGAVAWSVGLLQFNSPQDAAAALVQALENIPPGCDGLMFHTALTGSRFPDWDPLERGSLSGIEPRHGNSHILRAAQEGAAFTVANALDAIRNCGAQVERITVVGGLAADDGAVQLRADALGIPVSTLMTEEASSVGAAMFAGVSAGLFPDLISAAERFVRLHKQFQPRPDVMLLLERARQRWSAASASPNASSASALATDPRDDRRSSDNAGP